MLFTILERTFSEFTSCGALRRSFRKSRQATELQFSAGWYVNITSTPSISCERATAYLCSLFAWGYSHLPRSTRILAPCGHCTKWFMGIQTSVGLPPPGPTSYLTPVVHILDLWPVIAGKHKARLWTRRNRVNQDVHALPFFVGSVRLSVNLN